MAERDIKLDTERRERLEHVAGSLARHDNTDTGFRRRQDDIVQLVGAHIGLCSRQLHLTQAPLLIERAVATAQMNAVFRQLEIRRDKTEPVKIDAYHSAGIHCVCESDQSGPCSGEAAHGPAMDAVVQHVLDGGGVQYRDLRIGHREL